MMRFAVVTFWHVQVAAQRADALEGLGPEQLSLVRRQFLPGGIVGKPGHHGHLLLLFREIDRQVCGIERDPAVVGMEVDARNQNFHSGKTETA
jgi:hypothetical protein